MIVIKKLDIFILKKFLLTFVGAFFVCLFVFMMQFTWRYVDELVGKGLSVDILGKFFWYMGISLVPTALPLAILLAALITFGNMAEQLELLAMKAAGVPLIRIMRPIACVVFVLTGVSFIFQNSLSPHAQVSLRTLLFSMKQQSPAVEIPEGVFYSGVPNVNLYVERKDAATGMLYQLIIYKTDQGFDKAQIVLADSGRMEMTADKMHLRLDLWSGEQFENLQSQNFSALQQNGVPYDRETFGFKRFLIDFDSNFNLMDEDLVRGMPQAKDMREIEQSVDSVESKMDSVGREYYKIARKTHLKVPVLAKKDSVRLAKAVKREPPVFDTLFARLQSDQQIVSMQRAAAGARSMMADLEWKSPVTQEGDAYIRRHWVEWHNKMALSLSCLFFFFVGAPLGAIIRKGGLGMPTVISVLIFIFYYIINTSGMKMARDGSWSMVYGMWISSVVLLPFGVFLTYKSNKDSVVFNLEAYLAATRRLFGWRSKRHIFRKEVIIDDPDYDRLLPEIAALRDDCRAYNNRHKLYMAPGYIRVFFRYVPDRRVEELNNRMETMVEELANSRDPKILQELNNLPLIYVRAHTSPFHSRRLNVAAGILLPVGFVLWLRIWRFRLRLLRDMRQIVKSCDALEMFVAAYAETPAPNCPAAPEVEESAPTEGQPSEPTADTGLSAGKAAQPNEAPAQTEEEIPESPDAEAETEPKQQP